MGRGIKLIWVGALLCAVLCGTLIHASPAMCTETKSAPDQSSDPLGAVVDLLKMKGVITDEDAAALNQKMGKAAGSPEGMAAVVDLLVEKGVVTPAEAAAFKQKYAKPVVAAAAAPQQRVIRVEAANPESVQEITKNVAQEIKADVQDQVKSELKADIANEAKAQGLANQLPDWVQRIRFGGDMRLRYEGDYYGKNNALLLNPANPSTILNTTNDQNRALIRARLEADAKINDQVEADIRLSTGNDTNPVTTNATLGNYFNKANVVFDRAFIDYTAVKDVNVIGGIMGNPFFHTSDMVWDPDLSFDGIAVNAKHDFCSDWGAFVNAGIFPLDDESVTEKHRWLYAGQVGGQVEPADKVTAKLGVAMYVYENIVGTPSPPDQPGLNDYTAPIFQQKGNTLFNIEPTASTPVTGIASDFRELDISGSVDVAFWDPVHVIFSGEYVRNLGFNQQEVALLTGDPTIQGQTVGYQVGTTVGNTKIVKFPDWDILLYYEYLEADAALDAFTDVHFHGGGTNAKGWVFGGELGLMKNVWLRTRYYSTDQISGPPLAIDTLLVDLNTRF